MKEMATEYLDRFLLWIDEVLPIVVQWLNGLISKISSGSFANLTHTEIAALAAFVVTLGVLLWKILRRAVRSQIDLERSSSRLVKHEGRWTVYGYEQPFKAEHRQRSWRKKLMTPEEQQLYVDRVQEEERKKRPRNIFAKRQQDD